MKYCIRSQTYKASNVTFNAVTQVATSYGWWNFVQPVGAYLVFNNYAYSNTTARHQHKVRYLLRSLGIEPDFIIEVPSGLQDQNWRQSAIRHYENKIKALQEQIAKPRSRKEKNLERTKQIEVYQAKIELLYEI